jgi:hypothetical protein
MPVCNPPQTTENNRPINQVALHVCKAPPTAAYLADSFTDRRLLQVLN